MRPYKSPNSVRSRVIPPHHENLQHKCFHTNVHPSVRTIEGWLVTLQEWLHILELNPTGVILKNSTNRNNYMWGKNPHVFILSSSRNWFVIRVLRFSKLTKVNEELCVHLKFLWSKGKNSAHWTFEDCRHIGLGNLKPSFCVGPTGRRPHGNVTGMVHPAGNPSQCSVWKYFYWLCWSTQTSDRDSGSLILSVAFWALSFCVAPSLTGVCKEKAERTPPQGDTERARRGGETEGQSTCPGISIPSFLSQAFPCSKITPLCHSAWVLQCV